MKAALGKAELAARRVYREGVDALMDRRWGVRTSEEVDLTTLGVAGRDRHYYAPSTWSTLRKILPRSEVSEADGFVDFGSGKGRVLLQAAAYPFRRVVGVEISAELNAIARRNVESRRRHLVCRDVEIVDGDVLRVIQEGQVDLVRPRLSCGDAPPIKIAE